MLMAIMTFAVSGPAAGGEARTIRSSPRKRGPRAKSTGFARLLLDSRFRGNERSLARRNFAQFGIVVSQFEIVVSQIELRYRQLKWLSFP